MDNPDQDNMYKEVTTQQVVVGDQLQVEQEVEVKVDLQVDRMEEGMDQDLEDPMEVEMEITEIIGAHLDLVEMVAVTTTITTMKMKRSLVTQINLVTIQTITALTL